MENTDNIVWNQIWAEKQMGQMGPRGGWPTVGRMDSHRGHRMNTWLGLNMDLWVEPRSASVEHPGNFCQTWDYGVYFEKSLLYRPCTVAIKPATVSWFAIIRWQIERFGKLGHGVYSIQVIRSFDIFEQYKIIFDYTDFRNQRDLILLHNTIFLNITIIFTVFIYI